MTGASVPEQLHCVVKIEDVNEKDGFIHFNPGLASRGMNIAYQGEDLKFREEVLSAGRMIDPACFSVLASTGKYMVDVFCLPRVTVISTGDEIVKVDASPGPSEIRDANAYSIFSFLQRFEINPIIEGPIPDEESLLKPLVEKALAASDIVVITGGVSMGDKDIVPGILKQCGVEQVFLKVKIRPGKPAWFGAKSNSVVFAFPGNPFSVQVALKVFLEPYLRKAFKMQSIEKWHLPLNIARTKKHTLREFFPARIYEGGNLIKEIPYKSSGDFRVASISNGIVEHPEDSSTISGKVLFIPW